jgi:hypothetical protein
MLTPESKLSFVLGPSRNELRRLRGIHLQEGVDWLVEKRRVMWTLTGVEKIRAVLTLPPEKTASVPACAVATALPAPVTLLVYNARLFNKKMILAYAPGTDPGEPKNILRVRVRSSENFMRFVHGKAMEIKARLISGDQYELVGNCPRRKGWVSPIEQG